MENQTKNQFAKLLEEVKVISIDSLKNFFKLLDINPELLRYIDNIDIKIGKTDDDAPAQYNPYEKTITMGTEYFYDMLYYINNNSNDEKIKRNVILNMAVTLVHEMIHVNRTMMVQDGVNPLTIWAKAEEESIKYQQLMKGHDLNQYRMFLSDMLNKPYISEFKKFIPIKRNVNEDGGYSIIAYNRETKNYNEFINQYFNASMDGGIDEYLHQIGIELNNEDNVHKPTTTIYTFIKDNSNGYLDVAVACDYYHPYSSSGRLVNGSDIPSSKISTEEYKQILNKKVNGAIDRIENAMGFEEIITELLANIIVMTRNRQRLDLDEVTEIIYNSSTVLPDERVMAKFIQQMGIPMLKWFLTSTFTDYYIDELEQIFQERYDDLLLDFNDLYESSQYEDEPNPFSINDINSIVESKVGKKK